MLQPQPNGADDKRRRILDAAMAVCEERGVHAARMEEVAARAQVSKGTLYRFYESKEDLFLASIIDSYEQGQRARAAAVGTDDGKLSPGERLCHRLEGLVKVLSTITPLARVHYQAWGVVADSRSAEARLLEFLTQFHRMRHGEYERIVREGQLEGVFRSGVDPDTVAHMISSILSGFVYRAAFDPAGSSPDALAGCFNTLLRDVLGFSPDGSAPHRSAPHGSAPDRSTPHRSAPHRSGNGEASGSA